MNDAAYKVAWVQDAKNSTNKTHLAFAEKSRVTNEVLRYYLHELAIGRNHTWEATNAFVKSIIKPGLTYKCLTSPDSRFTTTGGDYDYCTYTNNVWNGNHGNADEETLFNYLETPNIDSVIAGIYINDSFSNPENWDNVPSEQTFDSFYNEAYLKHTSNGQIHFHEDTILKNCTSEG